MRYAAWIGANILAAWVAPLISISLYAILPATADWTIAVVYPVTGAAVGCIQWAVLARWFGMVSRLGRLWIPATALGLVASVMFSWWFLLAPGLTSGLAQYGLVRRRWPVLAELWVAAATLGWVAGVMAVGLAGIAGAPWGLWVSMTAGAVAYGAATAPVLALVERLNPPEPAPMSIAGKLALGLACYLSITTCASGLWVFLFLFLPR
jgi:hypothetical protein